MGKGQRYLMVYVALAVVLYLCVLTGMYVFQRKLMYAPDTNLGTPQASGLQEMVAVNLTHPDGTRIVSWYKSASTNKPTLIYFQGNGGNIGDRREKVKPFLNQGIGVMLVGYRGYGNNPGMPTEEGLYADAQLALEFLSRTGITPGHWFFYGESLGAAISVEMARRQVPESPVAAVILEAPFSSMADAAGSHYPWIPVGLLLKDRFDSASKIAEIKAPLLLVHGRRDKVVPFKLGQKLFNAASEPKTAFWLDDADHGNIFDHGGDRLAIEFIERIWSVRN